jgi:hypothetical protein
MKLILAASLALTGLSLAEPLLKSDLSDVEIKGPKECWTVTDGVLTGKNIPAKTGSILWTARKFKDFTLTGEFKFTGRIDSGVFLRTEGDQIQIGISGSLKRDMTGSPYIAKTGKYPKEADVKALLKEGEWNTFTITAKGNQYLVSLNGKQVMDYTSETAVPEGPIGFQVHPGVEMTIDFRKLDVTPLAPAK